MSRVNSNIPFIDAGFQPDRKLLVEEPYKDVQKAAETGFENSNRVLFGNFKNIKNISIAHRKSGVEQRIHDIWKQINHQK